jgi:hypothetical protein
MISREIKRCQKKKEDYELERCSMFSRRNDIENCHPPMTIIKTSNSLGFYTRRKKHIGVSSDGHVAKNPMHRNHVVDIKNLAVGEVEPRAHNLYIKIRHG